MVGIAKAWDEASIVRAADLLRQNKSAGEVATEFKVSRNSVLGMVHRARQKADPRFEPAMRFRRPPAEVAEDQRRRQVERAANSEARSRKSQARNPQQPTPVVVRENDPGLGLSLWDLGERACHHVAAAGYCGLPAHGRTYCQFHRALMHRPALAPLCLGRIA